MAQIRMDVSEYEAMKENKKLLADALGREVELQAQLKKLHEEKVAALEAAQKKVIKVTRQEVTEHLYVERDFPAVWHDLMRYSDALKWGGISLYGRGTIESFKILINNIFKRTTSRSVPVDEVTTHGLDDVKAEIRAQERAKLKGKIEEAEDALSVIDNLTTENSKLHEKIEMAKEAYSSVEENYLASKEEYVALLEAVRGIVLKLDTRWWRMLGINSIVVPPLSKLLKENLEKNTQSPPLNTK